MARYSNPAHRYQVAFADGVSVTVWANSSGHARNLAILRRTSELPGYYRVERVSAL